ncbi:MAG: hypothetical protein MUO63_17275 [Desulfobulbaceae bacterium]|nr:hypothetical protein [Desulfobulbaceae bacterium]
MGGYDFNRPMISMKSLRDFVAIDEETAMFFGKIVKATEFANVEYKIRYDELWKKNNMKPPPSCGRIFSGYLVVRKLNQKGQYETWMPNHVFEELYKEK